MGVSTARILLAGASGLVGKQVLQCLLGDHEFRGHIVAPVRRPLAIADPRLTTVIAPSGRDDADALLPSVLADTLPALDVVVSCLGTTLKAAGSRAAFIVVDRDLVLHLAQVARRHGARHAIVVSSVGASRQSANFYLRIKGEVEDTFGTMGFERLDIVQPGLLLGNRETPRPGEALAQRLAPLFNPLLMGRFKAYRSIASEQVAGAIAKLTGETTPGRFVHTYDDIIAQAAARVA